MRRSHWIRDAFLKYSILFIAAERESGFLRLGKTPFLAVLQEISCSLHEQGLSMQEWASGYSRGRRSPTSGGGPLHPRAQGPWMVVQAAPVEGREQHCWQTRSLLEGRKDWALAPLPPSAPPSFGSEKHFVPFQNLGHNFRPQHPVGRGPLWASTPVWVARAFANCAAPLT